MQESEDARAKLTAKVAPVADLYRQVRDMLTVLSLSLILACTRVLTLRIGGTEADDGAKENYRGTGGRVAAFASEKKRRRASLAHLIL